MTRTPTEAEVEAAKYIDRALWQEERLGSDLSGVNWQAVVGLMRGEMLKAKAALAAGPGSVEAQERQDGDVATSSGPQDVLSSSGPAVRDHLLKAANWVLGQDDSEASIHAADLIVDIIRPRLNAAPAGEVEG